MWKAVETKAGKFEVAKTKRRKEEDETKRERMMEIKKVAEE